MPQSLFNRSPHALWSRAAAVPSFAAVLSALLALVGRLAKEVRTGKLGGFCSTGSSPGQLKFRAAILL